MKLIATIMKFTATITAVLLLFFAHVDAALPLISAASSDPQYNEIWAGAVLFDHTFTSVTGTIIVPNPQDGANSGGKPSSAAAWVGIGNGDHCAASMVFQTGISITYDNGNVSFSAWYVIIHFLGWGNNYLKQSVQLHGNVF